MKLLNTYTLEMKKSKFIAYYYEIDNEKDVKMILEELKKEHKRSKHIPYAYLLENTARKSDDKEPSGTAGLPIYYVLEQNHLKNKAIFVVRYFGGTLLGSGLLTRCYKKSANEVII